MTLPTSPAPSSEQDIAAAVQVLRQRLPQAKPRIAVILGSGWGPVAERLSDAVRIPYADLPGFPQPSVQGHRADLVWGRIGNKEVVVLTGRKHCYETGRADGMRTALHTLRAWGCEVLVQTNAAGSVDPALTPGSLMVIEDHLNLPQRSPLIGEVGNDRFVSMVNAYDAALRTQAQAVAARRGVALAEGVYAWFVGPQFETPAEVRMAARLGANAVGMSTVPETLIARHVGLKVLALSLLTNMGAGLSDESLSHAHTLAQALQASPSAVELLCAVLEELAW